jgi:hypothetical protein
MQDTVIVRAFKGEPLQRVVLDAYDTRVVVAHPDLLDRVKSGESSPLTVPRTDVFAFDPDAFQRLSSEWRENGATDARSWRGLAPWAGRIRVEA